ncbi:hypothetical protein BUALT_Bualt03G0186400 [Buddleja alternifolia]|uniref:Uncharacterized protein n=1 Tax=Buddleja alternifolia TaxID=168488 RepID=A0AAV6XW59_9LAMI|nr:hypothetical protein BUALT_Bualt03G0186400 [Buddleja alternifolia]
MENKKLNLNRPLLSVRRYSPTVTSQKNDEKKFDNSLLVIPQLPHYRSELKSGPVRNPGAVPFQWEQTPGRPKEDIKPRIQNYDRPPISPKLPPGRYPIKNDSHQGSPITSSKNCRESQTGQSLDESIKVPESSKEENNSRDSGDHEEAYVDALDTLSRTQSFLLNCSLSGLDDLDANPSGCFSTDPYTREFMIDRFLPEAKAMASQTPQNGPKKQSLAKEKPHENKKIVPLLRYGPSFAKRYNYHDNEEEEEESDDDCDQHGNVPPICGLLPRFCLKGSLCLLNPVPVMRVSTREAISPVNKIQPSSSSHSHVKTDSESKSDIFTVKPVDKIQTAGLEEKKTKLRNEIGRLGNLNTSTYHDAPTSSLAEKGVIGISEETKQSGIKGFGHSSYVKVFKTFQELLMAEEGSPEESDSAVEKTLYVDTIQKVESPCMRSSSSEENEGINIKSTDQRHIIDSSIEDSVDKWKPKWDLEMPKAFGENQDFTTTENTEVAEKDASENLENQLSRTITPESSNKKYSEFPVPPPLPKSPSDSWLWRTLPTMSTKNVSQRSHPQKPVFKAPSSDIKWEAIVKSTKVQRPNLRYSEELLTPIPET